MPAGREFRYPSQELASRVFNVDEWGDPLAAFEEIGAQTRRTRPLRLAAATLRSARERRSQQHQCGPSRPHRGIRSGWRGRPSSGIGSHGAA
jgi:hypothetical protein